MLSQPRSSQQSCANFQREAGKHARCASTSPTTHIPILPSSLQSQIPSFCAIFATIKYSIHSDRAIVTHSRKHHTRPHRVASPPIRPFESSQRRLLLLRESTLYNFFFAETRCKSCYTNTQPPISPLQNHPRSRKHFAKALGPIEPLHELAPYHQLHHAPQNRDNQYSRSRARARARTRRRRRRQSWKTVYGQPRRETVNGRGGDDAEAEEWRRTG